MKAIFTAAAAALAALASPAVAEPFFIPLGNANAILVMDTTNDRIDRRIENVPAVHGLAATPDGRFLVAGSSAERPAGSIAPEKPAAVSEEEHEAHHAAPDAAQKPAAATVSTVSIIDTNNDTVVRRIDVPGGVHHVAADPTGRFAAVTHPALGSVTVIDLSTFTVAATIATGPVTSYAAFSPDGTRLYVSNPGNDTVSEIEVGSWIVRRNATAGDSPEHLVPTRDGSRLYVNNVDAGTVSVIATDSFEATETLAAGKELHGIDLSQDDETLFVAAKGGDRVIAFDLASGERREMALAPAPYHLAVVAGTGKIYVSSDEEPKLWVLDQATLAVTGEVMIGGTGHQMVQIARR